MSSARKKEFFGFVCVQLDSALPLKKKAIRAITSLYLNKSLWLKQRRNI